MVQNKKRIQSNVGISVTTSVVEAVVFSKKGFGIEKSASLAMPPGVLGEAGDRVANPAELGRMFQQLLKQLGAKSKNVHLSIPATLLRMVEMPKMDPHQFYISLSSEAERYKSFDDTEAVVDFSTIQSDTVAGGAERVIFGAVRQDALEGYLKALQLAKVKPASIDLNPLNTLRGMAGSGVLDNLVQQIGPDAIWGTLFVEEDRIRFFIWSGSNLLELREVHMETRELEMAGQASPAISELAEEIQRTTKTYKPAVWLTERLTPAANQALSEQLMTPFTPCLVGPGLMTAEPLALLSSVGVSMKSSVPFPMEFDLMAGLDHATTPMNIGKSSSQSSEEGKNNPLAGLLAGAAVLLWLLVLGGWLVAGLYGGLFLGQQVDTLETEKQDTLNHIISLNSQIEELKADAAVQQLIVNIARDAKKRNTLFVKFSQNLRSQTPNTIWLTDVSLDNQIAVQGKSMNEQDVITFSRSFDRLPYIQQVLLTSVKENFIESTKVFEFTTDMNANLNADALSPASPTEVAGQSGGMQ
ncbi:MAG: pilus assembly protein PilM [Vampirovibrio sp.]|nr:pilus assembly protein PilM [Vampirovibrio sp.]